MFPALSLCLKYQNHSFTLAPILVMSHKPYVRVLRDAKSNLVAWLGEVFQNLLVSLAYW
jgi:hypothetical protein